MSTYTPYDSGNSESTYPSSGAQDNGNVTPSGNMNSDEKLWAMIAHFGSIIAGFIAPGVTLFVKGTSSPAVRAHAVESLNFQLNFYAVYFVVSYVSTMISSALFFLPFLLWIAMIVFVVLAGLEAKQGGFYRHKLIAVRVIK